MSILDEIKAAEAAAAQAKKEAALTSRNILRDAEEAANREADAMITAAAVCMQKGLTDDEITVKLIGGELLVSRQKDTGGLWLTGPAVTVFTGEINIDAEDQRVFMKMNQRGEIYG